MTGEAPGNMTDVGVRMGAAWGQNTSVARISIVRQSKQGSCLYVLSNHHQVSEPKEKIRERNFT